MHEFQRVDAKTAVVPSQCSEWSCSFFGVVRVGPHENIFNLALNSLIVPVVQAELQLTRRREFSLFNLFERHTASAQAGHPAGGLAASRTSNHTQSRRAARNQDKHL